MCIRDSYCDVKSGYAFKSDWWADSGYKVIKIANIVNNSIDLDSCDWVAEEYAKKAENVYVKSGDILIAMTGEMCIRDRSNSSNSRIKSTCKFALISSRVDQSVYRALSVSYTHRDVYKRQVTGCATREHFRYIHEPRVMIFFR